MRILGHHSNFSDKIYDNVQWGPFSHSPIYTYLKHISAALEEERDYKIATLKQGLHTTKISKLQKARKY